MVIQTNYVSACSWVQNHLVLVPRRVIPTGPQLQMRQSCITFAIYMKKDQTCIQILHQFSNKFGPCLNKSSILCIIPLNTKCIILILHKYLLLIIDYSDLRGNTLLNKEKVLYYRNLISENGQDSNMLLQVSHKTLHRILDKVLPLHESKKSLALADHFVFLFAGKIPDILGKFSHTDFFQIPPSWSLLVS